MLCHGMLGLMRSKLPEAALIPVAVVLMNPPSAIPFARREVFYDFFDGGEFLEYNEGRETQLTEPPLVHFASKQQFELAALLLGAGVKAHSRGADGRTALMVAAEMGGPGSVALIEQLLIQADADTETQDNAGATVLFYALRRKGLRRQLLRYAREGLAYVPGRLLDEEIAKIFRLCLDRRRRVFAQTSDEDYEEAVVHLLSLPLHDGTNLLHEACTVGAISTVELLMDRVVGHPNGFEVDELRPKDRLRQGLKGASALYCAVHAGSQPVVARLLLGSRAGEHRPKIDVALPDGSKPLDLSFRKAYWNVAVELFQSGQVQKDQVSSGMIFDLFTENPCPSLEADLHTSQLLNYLLMLGCSPNMISDEGSSPVHLAAEGGYARSVEIFAERKANLMYKRRSDGQTALHLATRGGYVDAVKPLLRRMDVNLQNTKGESALTVALENGFPDIVIALLEAHCNPTMVTNLRWGGFVGAIMEMPIRTSLGNEDEPGQPLIRVLACVRKMIRAKNRNLVSDVDLNVALNRGYNAVHVAAERGLQDVVRWLAQLMHTDVNAVTDRGETPLILATRNHHMRTSITLVQLGAELEPAAAYGMSCLHWASVWGFEDLFTEMVTRSPGLCLDSPLPLDAGALDLDEFKQPRYSWVLPSMPVGVTALTVAVNCRQEAFAELLLEHKARTPFYIFSAFEFHLNSATIPGMCMHTGMSKRQQCCDKPSFERQQSVEATALGNVRWAGMYPHPLPQPHSVFPPLTAQRARSPVARCV